MHDLADLDWIELGRTGWRRGPAGSLGGPVGERDPAWAPAAAGRARGREGLGWAGDGKRPKGRRRQALMGEEPEPRLVQFRAAAPRVPADHEDPP